MARDNRSVKRALGGMLLALGAVVPVLSFSADIAPYPNAKLDLETQERRNNHPLVSSSMKKVNGVVLADQQVFLNGWLERRLYHLPSGHDSDQAFQFFTSQFEKLGVQPLYSCEQFSCGDSNFWANNIFDIARLYGLDKTQAYFIGTYTEAGSKVFYSTYTVRRGNHRVYALVDIFTPAESGGSRMLSSEEVELDRFPSDPAALKQSDSYVSLQKLLTDNPAKKLLVLFESAAPATIAELDSLGEVSDRTRQVLIKQLTADGIDPDRFRVRDSIRPVGKSNGRVRVRVIRME